MLRKTILTAFVFALFAVEMQAGVTVIDPGNQPGGPILTAALAAANNGDVILLKAGDYSTANGTYPTIVNKGVTLAPYDPSGPPITLSRLIASSNVDATLVVRGLNFDAPFDPNLGPFPSQGAIAVSGALRLVLEDCSVTGADAGICSTCGDPSVGAMPALTVGPTSSLVTVIRCDLMGGDGFDSPTAATAGAAGIYFTGFATIAQIYDTNTHGGDGGDGAPAVSFFSIHGGPGIFAAVATIHVEGGTHRGGDEGANNAASTKPGSGIEFFAGTMTQRNANFVAGQVNGAGTPVQPIAAPSVVYPAVSRVLTISPAPARSLEPLALEVTGQAGDLVVLYMSLATLRSGQPQLQGVAILGPLAAPPLVLGVIPGSGVLSLLPTLPQLPVGADSLLLHTQTTALSAQGSLTIGTPDTLLWIRDSL